MYACVCLWLTLFKWHGKRLSIPVSSGHGSLFACCNPAKLQGQPTTFFILHVLGGAVLFISDGIIVRLPANAPHIHTNIEHYIDLKTSSLCYPPAVFLALQGSYAGFVYTYAVLPPLLMGHKTAGCLTSIFWASITAGRLAFIYLSYRYTPSRVLTVSLVWTLTKSFLK